MQLLWQNGKLLRQRILQSRADALQLVAKLLDFPDEGNSPDTVPQTVLALRGSDGFSRDLWSESGVNPRGSSARSHCKNAYLVTLTFATLEPEGWSRAQTHKNSLILVNFGRPGSVWVEAASKVADVCC